VVTQLGTVHPVPGFNAAIRKIIYTTNEIEITQLPAALGQQDPRPLFPPATPY
jgi:hypothetical protein